MGVETFRPRASGESGYFWYVLSVSGIFLVYFCYVLSVYLNHLCRQQTRLATYKRWQSFSYRIFPFCYHFLLALKIVFGRRRSNRFQQFSYCGPVSAITMTALLKQLQFFCFRTRFPVAEFLRQFQ